MHYAKITVRPKKSILDPQGEAVRRAIASHGMEDIHSVRIGKSIDLEIAGDDIEVSKKKLKVLCDELLSNPVIEDYCMEVTSQKAE